MGNAAMSSRPSNSRHLLIVALGFFALVAQTLLFRDFLTVFEGNELGISAFFASWLVWIAVGARVARAETRVNRLAVEFFPAFTLLLIPAFVVQHTVIPLTRALIGVEAYVLFPFVPMVGMAFLVNTPVCFLTGYLFARACPWASEAGALPVARVYILETAGSFLGAIVSTFLLSSAMPGESVFLCATAILFVFMLPAARGVVARAALLALAVLLMVQQGPLGKDWTRHNALAEWGRLLPKDGYRRYIPTAQARYLYGERNGQAIAMVNGGVCDTFPPSEQDAEKAGLVLAQKPDAHNVLVFGENSLGICVKLKSIPQIDTVTWAHPDPEYARMLLGSLEVSGQLRDAPVVPVTSDIRDFLRTPGRQYDAIVLNLQDATTLVRNRYASVEFFALLRKALRPGGVVAARVSGGANFMGEELAVLNTSMVATLGSVFAHTALKPGDDTWVLASDGDGLSEQPGTLRDRYAAIPGASAMYPAEGIMARYPPDRIAFQRRVCEATIAKYGADFLRNTDLHPKAPFFALLLALKQAGLGSLSGLAMLLYGIGAIVFVYPVLLYVVLRCVFAVRRRRGRTQSVFDTHVLMFTTGFVGMAATIVFLFVYQVRYGSLFLDIGLLTALFMLGSLFGGMFSERLLVRGVRFERVLVASLAVQTALLLAAVRYPLILEPLSGVAGRAASAAPLLIAGLFTGVYFPIAAQWMERAGRGIATAGANLETLDTLGGAAGACVAGLALLPLLGSSMPLALLALLVAINVIPLVFKRHETVERGATLAAPNPWAYLLFGIAVYALLVSYHVMLARARAEGNQLATMARDMGIDAARLHETGTAPTYFRVDAAENAPAGYVFESRDWAPRIPAYGGPIDLAVHVDESGTLIDFRLMRSHETPSYVAMLRDWKPRLLGRNLFAPRAFQGIDAVSGATITSNAIMKALDAAGRDFATRALGKPVAVSGESINETGGVWHNASMRDAAYLAIFLALALALRFRPGVWRRRTVLLATALVGGCWLNLQYSAQHAMSLLGGNLGNVGINGPFFLVAIVPACVILFGNLYCGYVCPFGAMQELAGDLGRLWRNLIPSRRAWRYTRGIKYLLLFMVVIVFAATRDYTVLQADPLIAFFTFPKGMALVFGTACIGLSAFFPRFWCRNLCPAGAFLSLLSGLHVFRRWMPARRPAHCDMGVITLRDLDCLHCDRCMVAAGPERTPSREVSPLSFHGAVAVAALVFLGLTVSHSAAYFNAQTIESAAQGAGGKSRNVDLEKVQEMIRRHQLSDHPAEFSVAPPETSAQP